MCFNLIYFFCFYNSSHRSYPPALPCTSLHHTRQAAHTFISFLCSSIRITFSAPTCVSSMISSGVIWIWRRELYSRIFLISSTSKRLLISGLFIIIFFILLYQKCGRRVDHQILITFQRCNCLHAPCRLHIHDMLKVP